jgi:large subunit ribosomal protein L15
MLDKLKAPLGANRNRKRVGRGRSGKGKMSGRGHKGQIGRSGGRTFLGFEGGQMPMQRRLPKTGFKNAFKRNYAEINISDLAAHFAAGAVVTLEDLMAKRLVRKEFDGLKVLGNGDLGHALTVRAKKFSVAAKSKIEAAGGTAELV